MKSKILSDNCVLSFIHDGMGIKLSSFVKSIHRSSLIDQLVALF